MKLRNKKTGEIGYLIVGRGSGNYVVANNEWGSCGEYNSLAELNEEWKDYEEPDEIWYIDWKGDIRSADISNEWEREKEIGNYFETKEEAEKAVEKLQAWTRLKDKGFRFCSWFYDIENQEIKIKAEFKEFEEVIVGQKRQDLDLLFCPEAKNE